MEQDRQEGRFFCGLEEGTACMLGKAGGSPRGGVDADASEPWIRKHGANEGQVWVEGWDLSLSAAREVEQLEQLATLLYPFHPTWILA